MNNEIVIIPLPNVFFNFFSWLLKKSFGKQKKEFSTTRFTMQPKKYLIVFCLKKDSNNKHCVQKLRNKESNNTMQLLYIYLSGFPTLFFLVFPDYHENCFSKQKWPPNYNILLKYIILFYHLSIEGSFLLKKLYTDRKSTHHCKTNTFLSLLRILNQLIIIILDMWSW